MVGTARCAFAHPTAAAIRTTIPARHLMTQPATFRTDLPGLRSLGLRLHLLRADRQQQLIVVIGDAVDAGGDRVPDEFAEARGRHQRQDRIDLVTAAIEPAFEIARADGDGHAVMQRGEILARRRRDDRHRVELLAVRPDPGFEHCGEAERRAVGVMDEERLLAAVDRLPFVIAVGRDQPAPPANRSLERGLLQHRLRAGIDQERKSLGVLDPTRQQAPAHQTKMARAILDQHDRNWLRRRDIVPGREIRLLDIAEQLPQSLGGRSYDEASTHLRASI